MRKFWAVACTLAFLAFWVFGGLAVLAWMDLHPLRWVVSALSLAGLALGVWSRIRLVMVTRAMARGTRVTQAEDQVTA